MSRLIKIVAVCALFLNFAYAKSTLSIDGYMSKILFMSEKDGGIIYIDNKKKGMTSSSGPLVVEIESGEYDVKVCFSDEKYNICGEKRVYVGDNTQSSVSIKADKKVEKAKLEIGNEKCDKNKNECFKLGEEYFTANDYTKAAEFYQKGCDGGDARGCTNLGGLYYNGNVLKEDKAKAVELLKKGCDGRDGRGCFNLGYLYRYGIGLKEDKTKATKLFKKACNGGDARGCKTLKQIK
ncbi:tetratricopeptide repeat protein [Campylobacter sp. 9BO]|uniref:tetratricopeptide repeat protein n=1 Tax=Campylobacter sp. 9BO TaxID=3424759 RepID=UPI003D33E58E